MKNKGMENCPIKAGALLLTEEPFAYVLAAKEKGQRCDYCLKQGKVLKCSVCQFVHYCGRTCQKEAWNDHKWECSNLKRTAPKVLPDAARLLARIICRLGKGDGHTRRAFHTPTSFRMWRDLMSHYSDLKVDKRRMDHFTSLSMVLYEFFRDMSMPNTAELIGIYGRMCINSFTLLDVDMNSIGTAIYLGASVVDHSCRPNAVATFDGPTISIRATEDIPSLDWDRIRISYIDLMKTAYERQAELMKSYYFLCQCERCMDEHQMKLMHGAKCPNDLCENPVKIPWRDCQLVMRAGGQSAAEAVDGSQNGDSESPNVVHCSECGAKVTEKQVEAFIKAMEFTELHLQNMRNADTSYVDVCQHCLARQEGILHPLNVARAQTLDHAVDALIQLQLWEPACVLAEPLLPCFRNYYGDIHPLTGLLHLKFGKILLYKMRVREALDQLKSAQRILKITHGDRHPLYREQLLPLLEQACVECH